MISEAASKQEEFIQAARKLLKPGAIKLWGAPVWFKKAYRKSFGGCKRTEYGDVVTRLANNHGFAWLDHFGESVWYSGEKIFVSEPYQITNKDHSQISELARELDCEYRISSNSWWYPGHTIRIEFYEKKR